MDSWLIKEAQQQTWGEQAEHHERVLDPLYQPIIESLIERACLRGGESVLDVGAGTGAAGRGAAGLVGPAGSVIGIDLAPEMVQRALERARAEGLANFLAQAGDAEVIPFGGESFDVVLSSLTYMLCPEPLRALAQAQRVLRPGGRLVLAVWGRPENCAFHLVWQELGRYLEVVGPSLYSLGDVDQLWKMLRYSSFRPAVESIEVVLEYAGPRAFFDTHAFAARTLLTPDEYEAAADAVAAKLPRAGGPLRLSHEVVFAVGYR